MARRYSKYVMGSSALFMFCFGVLLTFAPSEILHAAGGRPLPLLLLATQTGGALYLGFAILNWMAKDSLIGGIFNRPVAMGNFLHFLMVALAMLKAFSSLSRSTAVFALFLTYFIALGFPFILFRHPRSD